MWRLAHEDDVLRFVLPIADVDNLSEADYVVYRGYG